MQSAAAFRLDPLKVRNPDVLMQISKAFADLADKYRAYPNALAAPIKDALPIIDALVNHYADQADVEDYQTHVSDDLEWLVDAIDAFEERNDPYADRRSDYDEHSTLNRAQQGIVRRVA